MAHQELIAQLVALPDDASQQRFIDENASRLDDCVAEGLKKRADHLLRADAQRSLQIATMLQQIGEVIDDPLHRALGLLAEANVRCLGGLGEYRQAIALYDEAAGIYREHDRLVEEARSQVGKLYALAFLEQYEEALATGRWAAQILEENHVWQPLADLTLNLGLIFGRTGRDIDALDQFERASELYALLGEEGEPYLPWAEHNRAIVLRNLGDFNASIHSAQLAWECLDRSGQRVEAARARQNLALTYYVLGRYNEALVILDEVRDVFLEDGRVRDAFLVDLFVSDCLLQLRRFADVLHTCRRIREQFADFGAYFEAAQGRLNEAVAFGGLKRHEKAMASLAEARGLFSRHDNHVWVANTDLETAVLLTRQGRFVEANQYALSCARVFQAHSLPIREAQANLVVAQASAALGKDNTAFEIVKQVLAVTDQHDIPSLRYQGHRLLGELAVAHGDQEEGLSQFGQAVNELERLCGRLMVEYRTDFLADKESIYEDMVHLQLAAGQPRQALATTERAKSRTLHDMLAYRLDLKIEARNEADRPLVEQLMRLREERDQIYRRWSGREELIEEGWQASDENRDRVRKSVLGLEKQITDLWHKLLVRNADYARDASMWHIHPEPLRPGLPSDTILLAYYIAHRQLIVFLVTQQEVKAHILPVKLGPLRRWIELFRLNVKSVPGYSKEHIAGLTINAQGLLQKIFNQLIAPLQEDLAAYSKLIIIPHGFLHYLPFHALYDGLSYLQEKHQVSYLPVSSLLPYYHESRSSGKETLVFGHSNDGRLPFALREACTVADIAGVRPFLENEATLERLKELSAGCQTIHLAAHGHFRPDNPLFSGLALADGWLTTMDIFNLDLNASLVTLSACQTGQNVLGGGDELLGLMRALLYAGADSLVLSLWPVEDQATAELMENFYRKLAGGWTKGEALQSAQRQIAGGQPTDEGISFAHPYFWASFCLVGDPGTL